MQEFIQKQQQLFSKIKTIIVHDLLPTICKLSDLVKVPLLRLWIEKFLTIFIEWLKSATFHKVLHWSEETVVRWSNVWTIGWMRQNFDTVQFFKLVAGLSGGMRLCIVLLKQSVFSTNKTWVLFNQRIVDSILRVKSLTLKLLWQLLLRPNSFSNNDAAIHEAQNLWFRNQTS